jgi:hypothetical protein
MKNSQKISYTTLSESSASSGYSEAFFNSPAHGTGGKQRISIPEEILLEDGRKLGFSRPKTLGTAVGGFYKDEFGTEFMVKMGDNPNMENSDERLYFINQLGHCEALFNDMSRAVLGENSNPRTQLGKYSANGVEFPCFISQVIPDYRDISNQDFSEEERKTLRAKFHPDYVFNALIANDDIFDDNLGVDGQGNAINVDYGSLPSFVLENQKEYKHNVHQIASFIGHQSLVGKQITKKRFFGYDEQLNPLEFGQDQKIKDNDISYYDILLGAKNICEKKTQIMEVAWGAVDRISQDRSIPDSVKSQLLVYFRDVALAFEGRVNYLERNFSDDFAYLEPTKEARNEKRDEFKNLKWRKHQKFKEIFAEHRITDSQIAQQCYGEEISNIAQIIRRDGTNQEITRDDILQTDFSALDKEQQEAIKNISTKKFLLHGAVINKDLEMAKWLLNNNISDINAPYRQRDYGYQHHMTSPLSTAISIHNDAMHYDHEYHVYDEMIEFLNEKFEEKNPNCTRPDYISDTSISFVLRIAKIAFNRFSQTRDKIEDQASSIIGRKARESISLKVTEHQQLEQREAETAMTQS